MSRLHHDLGWIAGVGDRVGNRAISGGTCEDRGFPGTNRKESRQGTVTRQKPNMMHPRTRTSSRSLETLFRLGNLGSADDGQLLERFRTCSDAQGAEAFRVLVERYGPIVMGVCRGVLGDVNHADDAFQATFLVLVRKAGSIRNRESIGPWLHGVALRVARRARAQAARRNALEKPLDGEVSSALALREGEPEERIGRGHGPACLEVVHGWRPRHRGRVAGGPPARTRSSQNHGVEQHQDGSDTRRCGRERSRDGRCGSAGPRCGPGARRLRPTGCSVQRL